MKHVKIGVNSGEERWMGVEREELLGIGQRMKNYRSGMKISQEEFVSLINISTAFYRDIEYGKVNMSIDTLTKIKKITKLPADYILYGELYAPVEDDKVIDLLKRCTKKEREVIGQILALIFSLSKEK